MSLTYSPSPSDGGGRGERGSCGVATVSAQTQQLPVRDVGPQGEPCTSQRVILAFEYFE